MKKLLLLCSALTLAGCNSSPSTGDVEKFLEPKFASCENIKVTNIKKTNGYEEDGRYRVEYNYGITLKDASKLQAMKQIWETEKAASQLHQEESKQHYGEVEALKEEILALEREFDRNVPSPRQNTFSTTGHSFYLTPDQQAAYEAAIESHNQQRPAIIFQKQERLEALKASWSAKLSNTPNPELLTNEGAAVYKFYRQGCPSTSYKFTEGMLQDQAQAANQSNDPSRWFEASKILMKGSVTMRKTENGWRALSAS